MMLMDKKGELPFWLIMAILILVTLIVMLIIVGAAGGKLHEFTDWFRGAI